MACVKFHDLTVIIAIVELWATAVNGYYANETVNFARAIHNDFEYFQKTGQRISGRDGRKLISFDTRNNNIEVGKLLHLHTGVTMSTFTYITGVLFFLSLSIHEFPIRFVC